MKKSETNFRQHRKKKAIHSKVGILEDGKGEAVTEKTVVNADMTVYAIYEKNETPEPQPEEKMVTFTAEGKLVKEVSIVKGETIGNELPAAQKKKAIHSKAGILRKMEKVK